MQSTRERYDCATCDKEYDNKNSLGVHYFDNPEHKPAEWAACPSCGIRYGQPSHHWAKSSDCDHPELTQHQREVLTGLLMGDGCVSGRGEGKTPYFLCSITRREYLQYLDSEIFPTYGCGVRDGKTAEQMAADAVGRGWNGSDDPENYQDQFDWYTCHSPEFQEFADWYATGQKVFPEGVDLTPTVLKHWFVCDGHWDNSQWHNRIELAMNNERENKPKIEAYFRRGPGVEVDYWKERGTRCVARFSVENTNTLFEYMGGPLPGFGYKFPT